MIRVVVMRTVVSSIAVFGLLLFLTLPTGCGIRVRTTISDPHVSAQDCALPQQNTAGPAGPGLPYVMVIYRRALRVTVSTYD